MPSLLGAGIILGAILVGFLFADWQTQRAQRLLTMRQVLFGALAVLIAVAAISTGEPFNIFVGAVILLFFGMWVKLGAGDTAEAVRA